MKFVKAVTIWLILSATLASAQPVAWVQKLYGDKNLVYKEGESGKWYRAFLDQNAPVGTHFKTDANSTASLMFFLGGKAVLDKGSEIKIISERNVDLVSQGIELKQGTFWAKFDKQKQAPVRIKTAGGVMGIRGTEFVVQVAADGTTKLSLLEGDVLVEAKNGETFEAQPGNEVTFGPSEPLLHRLFKLEELNQRLESDLGPAFQELRDGLLEFRQSWRESQVAVRAGLLEAKQGLQVARLAALSGDDRTRRQYEKGTTAAAGLEAANQSLAKIDQLLKGLEIADQNDQSTDVYNQGSVAQGTNTDSSGETAVLEQHPTLSWAIPEGERYSVIFLDAKDDKVIHWVDETSKTTYTHPSDAKPLAPGLYRFRVIPLNTQGEIVGEAIEGRFRV